MRAALFTIVLLFVLGVVFSKKLSLMQSDSVAELDITTMQICNNYTFWKDEPKCGGSRAWVSFTVDRTNRIAYTATYCEKRISMTALDLVNKKLLYVANTTTFINDLHYDDKSGSLLEIARPSQTTQNYLLQSVNPGTLEPIKILFNLTSFGAVRTNSAWNGATLAFIADSSLFLLDPYTGSSVSTSLGRFSNSIYKVHLRGSSEVIAVVLDIYPLVANYIGVARWKVSDRGSLDLIAYDIIFMNVRRPLSMDSILNETEDTFVITWSDTTTSEMKVGSIVYKIPQEGSEASYKVYGPVPGGYHQISYLFYQ